MEVNNFKGMKDMSSLLEKYLPKNIKIRKAVTLFPPTSDMSLLRDSLCPFCKRKLKLLMRRPLYICGRKTCPATIDKDPFKVSAEKLAQILAKNESFKKK